MMTDFIRPPPAPVFDPTLEEFEDPISYIRKISPVVFNSGVCKIRPPKGWKPPFSINERTFTFTPRVQDLADVCAYNRVRYNFITSLASFWEAQDVTLFLPQIKGKNVDLYKLWKYTKMNDGYVAVCEKKLWCRVCELVGIPSTPAFASALCSHYRKFLLPYDQFIKENKISDNHKTDCVRNKPSVNKMLCSVCGLGNNDESLLLCDGCDTAGACHTYCLSPPLSDVPKGNWYCSFCVVRRFKQLHRVETFGFRNSNTKYTLHKFGIRADDFKMKHFGKPCHMVSLQEAESEFWRLVNSENTEVTVEYGADLNARTHGSGFPMKRSCGYDLETQFYADSPWNLCNLSTLEDSALRFLPHDISGMIVPWCYVGMLFSCFCWHTEDHWSYSINYLHMGEPKTWYGVPTGSAEAFENAMRSEVPELFDNSPDLLHHMTTILSPVKLQQHGVPVYRLDQMPGEFVVTFPRSFHAGFNQGFNFAEAVNFCPPDWFDYGRHCIEHYALLHRTPVFSHSELICRMAQSIEPLSVQFLVVITKQLNELLVTERTLRLHVARIGVRRTERIVFEDSADEKRECELCRTTLYLSSLTCKCTETMHCLNHYQQRMCCSREEQVLRYRYDLNELTAFRDRLQLQLDDYDQWQKRIQHSVFNITNEADNLVQLPTETLADQLVLKGEQEQGDQIKPEETDTLNVPIPENPTERIKTDDIIKQEQIKKLSLTELKDLLHIGQMRNYPKSIVRHLAEIVHTVSECSHIIQTIIQRYTEACGKVTFSHMNHIQPADTSFRSIEREDGQRLKGEDKDGIATVVAADGDDVEEEDKDDTDRQDTQTVSSSELEEMTDCEDVDVVRELKSQLLPNQMRVRSAIVTTSMKVRGPVVTKLTLQEFNALVDLVKNLPVDLREYNSLQNLVADIQNWETIVRDLITLFNEEVVDAHNLLTTYTDLMELRASLNVPSLVRLEELINFATDIDVELPELQHLRRFHECLSWFEEVQKTLDQGAILSDTNHTIEKPSLSTLCELQLKGSQVKSVIAYVNLTNLDSCLSSNTTTLDILLIAQTKRLLHTICAAKLVDDQLKLINFEKPHTVTLQYVKQQLTNSDKLSVWLPIVNDVRCIYEKGVKYGCLFNLFDKFIHYNYHQPMMDSDSSIEKLFVEHLNLGGCDSTPANWRDYFNSLCDDVKDCVIIFPKLESISKSLSSVCKLHNQLIELFMKPSSKLSLLEILLPHSSNALEWLIHLDGGADLITNSQLNDLELLNNSVENGALKRQARSPNFQATTYKSMCKENAKEFSKVILQPKCDPTRMYKTLYDRFVQSEISLMQSLRCTNMRKSKARCQERIVYCVCRQPGFTGFMLQCELCRDWVHGRCVTLPNLKESETERMRYVCPRCECSLRPDLNDLINVLSDLSTTTKIINNQTVTSNDTNLEPIRSKEIYNNNSSVLEFLQFPEFIAAQLLCQRALSLIQHIRNILGSHPELRSALGEYERFSNMKMPFDFKDIDNTTSSSTEEEERFRKSTTGNNSIYMLGSTLRKNFTFETKPSNIQPIPSGRLPNRDCGMESLQNAMKYTKDNINPSGYNRQTNSVCEQQPSNLAVDEFASPELYGSTMFDSFALRKQSNELQTLGTHLQSAEVKETEIAETLAELSSISKTNLSCTNQNLMDTPNTIKKASICTSTLVTSRCSPSNNTNNISNKYLIQQQQRCEPTSTDNYRLCLNPNNPNHTGSSLPKTQQPHFSGGPSTGQTPSRLRYDNNFLPSNQFDGNFNPGRPHKADYYSPSKKFFYPLSQDAKKLLEMLIMDACLLEVSIPQTRWLWQLHLASDSEIDSCGAYRAPVAKLEEDRLKRRIMRHLQQNKPLSVGGRSRRGRKKRRIVQIDDEQVHDRKSSSDKEDRESSEISSVIAESPKHRRLSANRNHSDESSQSTISETSSAQLRLPIERKFYNACTDLAITRQYRLGRPRRIHSIPYQRVSRRSAASSGLRLQNSRFKEQAQSKLRVYRSHKSPLNTGTSMLRHKFASVKGGRRMRRLSGQFRTVPDRMKHLSHAGERLLSTAYRNSNIDRNYSSNSDEEIYRNEVLIRTRSNMKLPTFRGRRISIGVANSKRGQHRRRLMTKQQQQRLSARNDHNSLECESSADEDDCQAKPCLNPRSGTVEWIACDGCGHWFHQFCVGIHHKSQVPELYLCSFCRHRSASIYPASGHKQSARRLPVEQSSLYRTGNHHNNRFQLRGNSLKVASSMNQHPLGWKLKMNRNYHSDERRKHQLSHNLLNSEQVNDDGNNSSVTDDLPTSSVQQSDRWAEVSQSSGVDESDESSMHSGQRFSSTYRPMIALREQPTSDQFVHVQVPMQPKDPTEVLLEAIDVVSSETGNSIKTS